MLYGHSYITWTWLYYTMKQVNLKHFLIMLHISLMCTSYFHLNNKNMMLHFATSLV